MRRTRRTAAAAALLIAALLALAAPPPAAAAGRGLRQQLLQPAPELQLQPLLQQPTADAPLVSATASTPVTVNAAPSPGLQQQQQQPLVTAQSGGAKLAGLGWPEGFAAAKEGLLAHVTPAPAPAPAATPVVVLPAPQVSAVPTTTTGGIRLATSTPVRVSSPINVTTPVEQKNFQKAGSGDPHSGLSLVLDAVNTLANLGTLGSTAAGAAGSITGAVPAWIDAFLPDCPPGTVGSSCVSGLEGVADLLASLPSVLGTALPDVLGNLLGGALPGLGGGGGSGEGPGGGSGSKKD